MSAVWMPLSSVASQAFLIVSAISAWPTWTSSCVAARSSPDGLATSLPAMSGAEPCTASNIATPSPTFAEPASPTEPATCDAMSDRMSP